MSARACSNMPAFTASGGLWSPARFSSCLVGGLVESILLPAPSFQPPIPGSQQPGASSQVKTSTHSPSGETTTVVDGRCRHPNPGRRIRTKGRASYSPGDGSRSAAPSCSWLLCSAPNSTCRTHRLAGPCRNNPDERTAEADSYTPPCSQVRLGRLSHSTPPAGRPSALVAEGRRGLPNQACSGVACPRRESISRWVRRMLHHSLCSAMGIPHSTQIRTRWRGSALRENSFFRNDMESPFSLLP